MEVGSDKMTGSEEGAVLLSNAEVDGHIQSQWACTWGHMTTGARQNHYACAQFVVCVHYADFPQ